MPIIRSSNSFSGYLPKHVHTRVYANVCSSIFIMVKSCEQPRCISTIKGVKKYVLPYNNILLSKEKEQVMNTFGNMDKIPIGVK